MNGVCGAASCNAGFAFSWTAGKCTNILTDTANWYVLPQSPKFSVGGADFSAHRSQRFDRQRVCHLFRPHPGMLGWILHRYLVPDRLHSRWRSLHQDYQPSHRHEQLVSSRALCCSLGAKAYSVSLLLFHSGTLGNKCPSSYSNGVGSVCSLGVCQPLACSLGYAFDYSTKQCRNIYSDTANW